MNFLEIVLLPLIDILNRYSEKAAFVINEKSYTYFDLKIEILRSQEEIRRNVTNSKNVGVVVHDDLKTYASLIAVWMEGFAYIPLHPKQPKARINEMIIQSDVEIVLDSVNGNTNSNISEFPAITYPSYLNNELIVKPTNDKELAYILFTSGSTGNPKGVKISRQNISSFVSAFDECGIVINESDKCLQAFDLTFDVSVQSFLIPLLKGASVFTIPHDQIKYSYAYGLLEEHGITFGAMAPSMIRYLRPYFSEINLPDFKYCILTAEASPVDLVNEWSECIPNATIFNFYGPTEATIYCTYFKVTYKSILHHNGMMSIGKPMNGIDALIINTNGVIIDKQDLEGELCLAGGQVSPGYWKNELKNSESFFSLIYKEENTLFYKTGDLCYYSESGNIMLIGRKDNQVKIQGYRIELGEIEYHARNFLNGINAIALDFLNKTGNTELVLFTEETSISKEDLNNYLKSRLPYYMIPLQIIMNTTFPLNNNGKIDRGELRKKFKGNE